MSGKVTQVVVLFLIGVGLLAIAIQRFRVQKIPAGGSRIEATVTRELSTKSSIHRQRSLYAPEAQYVEPLAGEIKIYTPKSYSKNRYKQGQVIELNFDPAKDKVWHISPRPVFEIAVLVVLGVAAIVGSFYA